MDISKIHLLTLWVEDKDGNRVEVDCRDGSTAPVETHPHAFARFPCELTTKIYERRPKDGGYGSRDRIGEGHSSFNESLTLALATGANGQPKYRLMHAIIIAACLCERCMNALANQYGLDWGYPLNSEQYKNNNTRCEACK